MDRKVIISLIVALIAIIVIGFVALRFVPTGDLANLDVGEKLSNVTENTSINVSESPVDTEINITPNDTSVNGTARNETVVNDTIDNATADTNDSDANAEASGDVLHKQTLVITGNQTGQYQGMEPGTYILYYTENDGVIKIDKVA